MSCRLAFALVILATTTTGSRLKPVVQHENLDSRSKGSITWKKDQMYMCTQKWEKSSGQYQNKFCLAELEEVVKGLSTGKAKMRASLNFKPCVAISKDYRFKVCNLKGKADRRLNYAEKVYVPKSCFEQLPDDLSYKNKAGTKFPLMMAAVSLKSCRKMFSLPPSSQRRLTKPADFADPISKDEEPVVTTTTVVKDEVKPDEPVETTTTVDDEWDKHVDEVVQQILMEDAIEDDSDGVEMGLGDMEDEIDPTDNAVEDSLETQDVPVDTGKSGELDLDEANIAQIRALWKKRVAMHEGKAK